MTGNELMSGVTVDSNSALIARLLEPLNLRVGCKLAIGDDMEQLCTEISRLAGMSEVLIVNGGLGPPAMTSPPRHLPGWRVCRWSRAPRQWRIWRPGAAGAGSP